MSEDTYTTDQTLQRKLDERTEGKTERQKAEKTVGRKDGRSRVTLNASVA